MATSQIEARWTRLGTLSQPKIQTPEEDGFEEEGQQGLDRERRTEDVADETAVIAPVHPELELLEDAGHHSEGEVDEEQLAEEMGELQVLLFVRPEPGRLK